MAFKFTRAKEVPDVVFVDPQVFGDARGFFLESYKASEFAAFGLPTDYVQDGHSRNVGRGILRGLHYQDPPAAQGKLVRCTVGACFDVAVDLRRKSPTYGKHVALTLSAEEKRMVWIPEGFAHGYVTLSDECEIQYKFTGAEFSAPHYRALRWNDPALGIPWPLERPQLSPKDEAAPLLSELRNLF
jgi:dTDP-4-dehydrorhamnose 3,5-epimerase